MNVLKSSHSSNLVIPLIEDAINLSVRNAPKIEGKSGTKRIPIFPIAHGRKKSLMNKRGKTVLRKQQYGENMKIPEYIDKLMLTQLLWGLG